MHLALTRENATSLDCRTEARLRAVRRPGAYLRIDDIAETCR